MSSLLEILSTDGGESAQYTVQVRLEQDLLTWLNFNFKVKIGQEEKFKSLFDPIVIDIQNHGRYSMQNYILDNTNDAYVEKISGTFC